MEHVFFFSSIGLLVLQTRLYSEECFPDLIGMLMFAMCTAIIWFAGVYEVIAGT